MESVSQALVRLGVMDIVATAGAVSAEQSMVSYSAIDGAPLGTVGVMSPEAIGPMVERSQVAFDAWRQVPAPVRGDVVRAIGNALREHKDDLAAIVSLEVGKITQEALGEVQEMIDICDYAVGLSRGLTGLTIASERPNHRLSELWHPLGVVGVISAFNFPVAVWAWNAMLAFVCGDPVIWKPSEKAPLCAAAVQSILKRVFAEYACVPENLHQISQGGADVGAALTAHPGVSLVSATGSVPMGRSVAEVVGRRLGKVLLELGGNNAAIVAPSSDLELAIRGIVFGAVGTCGQRCTTLRRLYVHSSRYSDVIERLKSAYAKLPIGNPMVNGTLVGPLIDSRAADNMQAALRDARAQGGVVHFGERLMHGVPSGGAYVHPALVEISADAPICKVETFAPILYVSPYEHLDDAIALNNAVPQGLSSAIFTLDVREAERFCSAVGSDCGIVNVNIGTSGAEIGGAFGGEKDTGGGRESGSDSWKAYMRRVTSTVNYGTELPLAQGIRFDI
ncbi:MAG: aldehyde dehydrogenase family protein [Armatimonadota bacterium]